MDVEWISSAALRRQPRKEPGPRGECASRDGSVSAADARRGGRRWRHGRRASRPPAAQPGGRRRAAAVRRRRAGCARGSDVRIGRCGRPGAAGCGGGADAISSAGQCGMHWRPAGGPWDGRAGEWRCAADAVAGRKPGGRGGCHAVSRARRVHLRPFVAVVKGRHATQIRGASPSRHCGGLGAASRGRRFAAAGVAGGRYAWGYYNLGQAVSAGARTAVEPSCAR